ncbi:MAG: hypothetical protein GWN20_11520, partial [Phycisphaerae bacterium]|nr:hypothetical protein [Phycisphaerae bacterium]
MNAKVLLAGLEPLDITATDVESLLQLYNLLFYTSPYVIVEAGTYKGHFSVAAARLLPKCHVFTADIDRFCELPDLPNLTFYHGDFADMMEEFNITHDFAFIDSGPATVEGFKNPNHVRLKHWK